MLEQVLIGIGFSHKEAVIYLAALELGPQPASIIAQQAHINRSTAYVILKSLMRKGVISTFTKNDIKYFNALEPTSLLQYIQRSTQELNKFKKQIEDNIGEFKELVNPLSERPKVRFFEGLSGVKTVYEDTLNEEAPIFAFESIDAMPQEVKAYIFNEYIPKRVSEKIPAKTIVIDSKQGRQFKKEDKKSLRESKLVKGKGLNIEINIYGGKVAFMTYHEAKYTGVIIENKSIADALRFIFHLVWQRL